MNDFTEGCRQIDEYGRSITSETHLYILYKLTSTWHGNTQKLNWTSCKKKFLGFPISGHTHWHLCFSTKYRYCGPMKKNSL